eukprot:10892381-Heterocapsa_arctica.AAC.1
MGTQLEVPGADGKSAQRMVPMGNDEEAPAGSPGVVGGYDGQGPVDGHHGDKEPQGALPQLYDQ